MTGDVALFDLEPSPVGHPVAEPRPVSSFDWQPLRDLAFLYTATLAGNSTGIRFAASIEDAKRWCSSPGTEGVMHGTPWAYFWTSAATYVRHCEGDADTYGERAPVLDLKGTTDNGAWDERIAAAGVVKIALCDLPGVLAPIGVEVKNAPPHGVACSLVEMAA